MQSLILDNSLEEPSLVSGHYKALQEVSRSLSSPNLGLVSMPKTGLKRPWRLTTWVSSKEQLLETVTMKLGTSQSLVISRPTTSLFSLSSTSASMLSTTLAHSPTTRSQGNGQSHHSRCKIISNSLRLTKILILMFLQVFQVFLTPPTPLTIFGRVLSTRMERIKTWYSLCSMLRLEAL